MATLSIGQVAKRSGVSVETIRFYEQKGLIKEPERKESGYRQYDLKAVKQLAFIRHAKELGFSLKEINDLLSLKSNPKGTRKEVAELAGHKLKDIESKIKSLQSIKRVLKEIVDQCPADEGPLSDCPILAAIGSSKE